MTVEEQQAPAKPEADTARETKSKPPSRAIKFGLALALLCGVLGLAFVVYAGITSRERTSRSLQQDTSANAVPTVSVVRPEVTSGAQEVILPGNMQAFTDTPIWARASGYLRAWYVDIGARVKKGQLLALIEAPEVDRQLQQAKANLVTSQANLKLAKITAERYSDLFKTDSVAKQDVDNAVQNAAARASAVSADEANVARLEQLVNYEKVYAPFDGVITARNIDVGALVDADANAAGKELFHLAANNTLRVYIDVPEVYSRAATPGIASTITLTEYPGREFHGIIVRNAKSIDVNSRTLLVEVDVKNPTGELLPGSYVSVHLKLPSKTEAVTVPSNALIFRSAGLQAGIVRDGRVQLVNVTLGRDYGDKVQVTTGLGKDDSVIVNPSDSLASGQQVHVGNPASGNQ